MHRGFPFPNSDQGAGWSAGDSAQVLFPLELYEPLDDDFVGEQIVETVFVAVGGQLHVLVLFCGSNVVIHEWHLLSVLPFSDINADPVPKFEIRQIQA